MDSLFQLALYILPFVFTFAFVLFIKKMNALVAIFQAMHTDYRRVNGLDR